MATPTSVDIRVGETFQFFVDLQDDTETPLADASTYTIAASFRLAAGDTHSATFEWDETELKWKGTLLTGSMRPGLYSYDIKVSKGAFTDWTEAQVLRVKPAPITP